MYTSEFWCGLIVGFIVTTTLIITLVEIRKRFKTVKLPSRMERADERMLKALINIGALYEDKNGIHTNNPGIYSKKIPAQTANQNGDK